MENKEPICTVNIFDKTTETYLNSKTLKYNVAELKAIEISKNICINKSNYPIKSLDFSADKNELIITVSTPEDDENRSFVFY